MKNKRVRGDLKGIEEQLVLVRSAVYAAKIIIDGREEKVPIL